MNIKHTSLLLTLLVSIAIFFVACKKDTDGSPSYKAGAMLNGKVNKDTGVAGTVLIVSGDGIGKITSIVFDKNNTEVGFTQNLNTDKNIIFRVPSEAAGGAQNIVLTNIEGRSMSIPFKVMAYANVASLSVYEFGEGTIDTLYGNNFDDISSVKLDTSDQTVEILYKERKFAVLKFPASEFPRSKLSITNSTGTIITSQELVNIDKAYKIFTENLDTWESIGWGGSNMTLNTDVHKFGSVSVSRVFTKDSWGLGGLQPKNWWAVDGGEGYSPDYKYITFYIKGASKDYSLWFHTNVRITDFMGNLKTDAVELQVPANVWTYFKIPIKDIGWDKNPTARLISIGWRIDGPAGLDETFYFDNIIITK